MPIPNILICVPMNILDRESSLQWEEVFMLALAPNFSCVKKCNSVFLFLIVISAKLFSQSISNNCSCRIPIDSTFQIVPMTQGPDVGVPPLYENDNAATPSLPLPFTF